jgi:hypothetical protein
LRDDANSAVVNAVNEFNMAHEYAARNGSGIGTEPDLTLSVDSDGMVRIEGLENWNRVQRAVNVGSTFAQDSDSKEDYEELNGILNMLRDLDQRQEDISPEDAGAGGTAINLQHHIDTKFMADAIRSNIIAEMKD